MQWSGFFLSLKFWAVAWILILLIGLTPLPPATELVIVVGVVTHAVWFVQHRLAAIASRRAEEEEFRRLRRPRALSDDSPRALARAELVKPIYHGVAVEWTPGTQRGHQ